MGRPRLFEEATVLDAAVREFHMHGFADTSTEQLCKAAGVGRSTLYNAFNSKDELFARALERYLETASADQAELLENKDLDGLTRLQGFLGLAVTEEAAAASEGHAAGCMVVGTRMTPDVASRDEQVKHLFDKSLRHQLAALTLVAHQGQADGSITKDVPLRTRHIS